VKGQVAIKYTTFKIADVENYMREAKNAITQNDCKKSKKKTKRGYGTLDRNEIPFVFLH